MQSNEPLYSPSQSPIHIANEQAIAEKLLQLGSLGEIAYTYDEIEDGMPQEPEDAEMKITNNEFKGHELDPAIK